MKVLKLIFIFGLIFLFLGCSAQPDPVSVIEELGRAEAANDAEAAVNCFAEDAIFKPFATSGVTTYQGREEIRIFFNGVYRIPSKIEFEDIQAEGNRVTWRTRRVLGSSINPVEWEWLTEAVVDGGKIVYMESWELTD